MASIQERIEKIPYFRGMQVQNVQGNNVIYVMLAFPEKWIVNKDIEEKFDITVAKEKGLYYFCAEMSVGFERVFDAIEYNIKTMKDAQEKAEIFKEKVAELEKIFMDEKNGVEKLKTIEITFKTKNRKKQSKNDEAVEENNVEETVKENE